MMLDSLATEVKHLHQSGIVFDRLSLWAWFSNRILAKNFVEIGVWKGEFSAHILAHSKSIKKYYMIDPWRRLPDWNKPFNDTNDFEAIYCEALERTQFASAKISVLRGRTIEVIDQIQNESIDMVYIDGDHTLRGISIDLISILPKIKLGGFIAGDDFTASVWQHSFEYEPTFVCPFAVYFAEANSIPIAALGKNQFIIQKTSTQLFQFIDVFSEYKDLSLNKLPEGFNQIEQHDT